jgi:hypothetical protein
MAHDYFKDYREAIDAMMADDDLRTLNKTLEVIMDGIEQAEAPYRDRLRKAEEGIHAVTLDQQRTIILHNIEAKYSKPRKSTSWKGVAMSFNPSDELIEEHSKVGSPSVSIKVHDVIDLEG